MRKRTYETNITGAYIDPKINPGKKILSGFKMSDLRQMVDRYDAGKCVHKYDYDPKEDNWYCRTCHHTVKNFDKLALLDKNKLDLKIYAIADYFQFNKMQTIVTDQIVSLCDANNNYNVYFIVQAIRVILALVD